MIYNAENFRRQNKSLLYMCAVCLLKMVFVHGFHRITACVYNEHCVMGTVMCALLLGDSLDPRLAW